MGKPQKQIADLEEAGCQYVFVGGQTKGRAHCHECGSSADVPANSRGTLSMLECVSQRLRNKGWKHKNNKWTCFACDQKPKEIKSMTPHIKPHNGPRIVTTLPPREPTLEARRIIATYVSENYLIEKGMWSGALSDKKVGEELGYPWSWVSGVRELYGEDRCQEQPLTRDELAAAYADLKAASDRFAALKSQLTIAENALKPALDRVTRAYDAMKGGA